MNNRKTTMGRPIYHLPIEETVGFTVKVKHGSYGYKLHEDYRAYFPVETGRRGENKQEQVVQRVLDARKLAEAQVKKNRFDCHIIERIRKTSKRIIINN